VRAKGAAVLRKYLDDALDVLERKIQILERKNYFGSIRGIRQAIDALLPTVRAASDEVLRGVYVGRIADKTGVPRDTLEREVAEGPVAERRRPGAPAPQDQRKVAAQQAQARGRETAARDGARLVDNPERIILLLMFRDEQWIERAAGELGPRDFRHPAYQLIYAGLVETEGRRDPGGEWLQHFPPDLLPLVEELRGDPEAATLSPAEAFFWGSLYRIRARSLEARLAEIEREIPIAPLDQQLSLFREKKTITDELRGESGYLRKAGLRPMILTDRPIQRYGA
jgi:DNA primase